MKTNTLRLITTLLSGGIAACLAATAQAGGPDFSGQVIKGTDLILEGTSGPDISFIPTSGEEFEMRVFNNHLISSVRNHGDIFTQVHPSGFCAFGSGVNPDVSMHVFPPYGGADAQILCDNSSQGAAIPRNMFELLNNGAPRFVLQDSSLTGINKYTFAMNPAGSFTMTRAGVAGAEIVVKRDGTIEMGPGTTTSFRVTGSGVQATSYQTLSDENSKTDIEQIEANDVLDKIGALPVSTWRFKGDHDTARHIGPMAQDFHKVFGEGDKEVTTINLSDMAGVALAGVKSLDQKVNEKAEQKDAEIAELRDALQKEQTNSQQLAQRLDRIESMLQKD